MSLKQECAVLNYHEIREEYDLGLAEWEEEVDRRYAESFRDLADPEDDTDTDEIIVKRQVRTALVRRIVDFLLLRGDDTLACRAAGAALSEAVHSGNRRMRVLISESGREWLRLNREELNEFLGGEYGTELDKFLGR